MLTSPCDVAMLPPPPPFTGLPPAAMSAISPLRAARRPTVGGVPDWAEPPSRRHDPSGLLAARRRPQLSVIIPSSRTNVGSSALASDCRILDEDVSPWHPGQDDSAEARWGLKSRKNQWVTGGLGAGLKASQGAPRRGAVVVAPAQSRGAAGALGTLAGVQPLSKRCTRAAAPTPRATAARPLALDSWPSGQAEPPPPPRPADAPLRRRAQDLSGGCRSLAAGLGAWRYQSGPSAAWDGPRASKKRVGAAAEGAGDAVAGAAAKAAAVAQPVVAGRPNRTASVSPFASSSLLAAETSRSSSVAVAEAPPAAASRAPEASARAAAAAPCVALLESPGSPRSRARAAIARAAAARVAASEMAAEAARARALTAIGRRRRAASAPTALTGAAASGLHSRPSATRSTLSATTEGHATTKEPAKIARTTTAPALSLAPSGGKDAATAKPDSRSRAKSKLGPVVSAADQPRAGDPADATHSPPAAPRRTPTPPLDALLAPVSPPAASRPPTSQSRSAEWSGDETAGADDAATPRLVAGAPGVAGHHAAPPRATPVAAPRPSDAAPQRRAPPSPRAREAQGFAAARLGFPEGATLLRTPPSAAPLEPRSPEPSPARSLSGKHGASLGRCGADDGGVAKPAFQASPVSHFAAAVTSATPSSRLDSSALPTPTPFSAPGPEVSCAPLAPTHQRTASAPTAPSVAQMPLGPLRCATDHACPAAPALPATSVAASQGCPLSISVAHRAGAGAGGPARPNPATAPDHDAAGVRGHGHPTGAAPGSAPAAQWASRATVAPLSAGRPPAAIAPLASVHCHVAAPPPASVYSHVASAPLASAHHGTRTAPLAAAAPGPMHRTPAHPAKPAGPLAAALPAASRGGSTQADRSEAPARWRPSSVRASVVRKLKAAMH